MLTLVETIKQVVVGDRLYQGGGDSSIFAKCIAALFPGYQCEDPSYDGRLSNR
jgi:hypothetical protein